MAVEVIKDVTLKVAPLAPEDIEDMLSEVKIGRMLRGFRGRVYDVEAVKRTLIAVSSMLEDFEEVSEIDVNPLFVYERGAVAVDVKVYLRVRGRRGP